MPKSKKPRITLATKLADSFSHGKRIGYSEGAEWAKTSLKNREMALQERKVAIIEKLTNNLAQATDAIAHAIMAYEKEL